MQRAGKSTCYPARLCKRAGVGSAKNPKSQSYAFVTLPCSFFLALAGVWGSGCPQDTAPANFGTTLAELARPFTLTLLGHQSPNFFPLNYM